MAEPRDDDEPLEPIDPFAGLTAIEDPFTKGASKYSLDPELTPEYMEGLGEMTDVSALIPEASAGEQLSQAALNMITGDPMELADILTHRFPDEVDVRLSPDGVPVARNIETGAEFAINKPGFSGMDVLQAIGMVGMYTPAGRLITAPLKAGLKAGLTEAGKARGKRALRRKAVTGAALGEGTTEHVAQRAQENLGGRYDPGEVALSAATAVVPEVVIGPLANIARKTWDLGKRGKNWPDSIESALKFAEENEFKIATADVLKEQLTAPRQIFLRGAERVPIVGTSKMKLEQIAQRADMIEQMFKRFGLDANTEYGSMILNSFVSRHGSLVSQATKLKQAAFKELDGVGDVPLTNFQKALQAEYKHVRDLDPDMRAPMEQYLNRTVKDMDTRESFEFPSATTFLESLYSNEAGRIAFKGDKGEMKARLGDAMYKDLKKYALANSDDAFSLWDRSRNVWQQGLKKVDDAALQTALATGKIDDTIINRVLDQGKRKDMRALYRHTTANGQALIKKNVLMRALENAGAQGGNLDGVKYDRLVHVFDKDKGTKNAMKEFWSPEEREYVEGAMNFLRYTAGSEKVGEAAGMIAAGQTGTRMMMGWIAALMPPTFLMTRAARIHESDAVRNLWLNLHHAKGNTVETMAIMSELRPALIALGNVWDEKRDPFAAEIEPTQLEKFMRTTGRSGAQAVGAVTGFELPGGGVEEGMEQLRTAAGQE